MIEVHDQFLLLVAALNQDSHNRLIYGILVIDQSSVSNPTVYLKNFTVLSNYSMRYSVDQEYNLRCLKMVQNSTIENLIYIYDKNKILCVDCKIFPRSIKKSTDCFSDDRAQRCN